MATSTPSSTSSDSSASTSSSSPTLTSSDNLFPQTFTDPFASPSATTTTSNTTGNGGSFSTGPPIASSASLYLYTFLATLVLLLSVSAAIILRSLLLRRRHRRMMEEAIANGTWIPPSPTTGGAGGSGRSHRVDLSRKPKMWEAHVSDEALYSEKGSLYSRETEWDWESLRPFSVSYMRDPRPKASPLPLPTADDVRPALALSRWEPRRFIGRVRQLISPTPAAPSVPLPPTTTNIGSPHIAPSISDDLGQEDDGEPKKIRLAVLIAMPSQANPHYIPQSQSQLQLNVPLTPTVPSSPSSLSAPSPSPSSSHPSRSNHFHLPSNSSTLEEPQLPHLEFGVAELVVRPEEEQSKEEGSGSTKELRNSVASSVDVV